MEEKQNLFNQIMETAVSRGFDREGKLRAWHMENTGNLKSLIWADDFISAICQNGDKSIADHKIEMARSEDPLEYLEQYL